MLISEALRINAPHDPSSPTARTVALVVGFTPLHIASFLRAYVHRRFPGSCFRLWTGLYGDLEGNLRNAAGEKAEAAAVVLEWSDLDPRLSLRSAAGWSQATRSDILAQVPDRLARLGPLLQRLAAAMPVALCPPTLPLPPLAHTPPHEASPFELRLRALVAGFIADLAVTPRLRVVSPSHVDHASTLATRRNIKLDHHSDFPYATEHADHLAAALATALFPPPPRKGIITDLDDTLWKGILGEVGAGGVTFGLAHGPMHGLYQQLLASLAEAGVLVAVASKNDPARVVEAFQRDDLLLKGSQVFPIEANWGPKSESVSRILKAWNIGPESVVFIDDSPMELAEVREKHPEIECFLFSSDAAQVYELLWTLRARFGKSEIHDEDRLRLQSLRSAAALEHEGRAEVSEDFLAALGAKITLDIRDKPADARALELVNKTNQFSLNGQRFTEGEWQSYFAQEGAFLAVVSYEDRFGPLGKIAVAAGRRGPHGARIDAWVMSCRAFSRRIEHQTLRALLAFADGELRFAFRPTDRNGPLQEFLASIVEAPLTEGEIRLSPERFAVTCPALHHEVIEHIHG